MGLLFGTICSFYSSICSQGCKGSDTGLKASLGRPNSLTIASSFALITSMGLGSLTLVINCDCCKEKINNLMRKKT